MCEHIIECKCLECHKKAIEELLQYFTSGNEIEIQKATIKIETIKDIFGKLFSDHKWVNNE